MTGAFCSPACTDALRAAASAVPDLTPTPRGPEAEVGNGGGGKSRRQQAVQVRGGNLRGTLPKAQGSPQVSPAPPS